MTETQKAMERLRKAIRHCEKYNTTQVPSLPLSAIHAILASHEKLVVALRLAEDVLSRFPFTSEIWPDGTHPNTGIEQIRQALLDAGVTLP